MKICFKILVFVGLVGIMHRAEAAQPPNRQAPATASAMANKPNIIFVLIDDLGKEWISCYGAEGITTPNIDRLASGGMKFNHAYSMPQCTPSRMCFMTGQYPWRNGWINHWDAPRWGEAYYDWNRNPSIARTMKQAGYATAVAGKWQLNDFRVQPDAMAQHGFDDWCMWTGAEGSKGKKHVNQSSQRYWNPYIFTSEGSKTYPGKFGPDIYNQFVLDFIEDHQQEPFFVYYPMALTHSPFVHTPHHPNAKTKQEKFTAMVLYADYLLGELVAHLDTLGLRKNTIIVWATDNGTSGSLSNRMDGRLVKGGKMKTTENGVNAPFIVNCPGRVPVGVVSDALVDFTDMHPTFADFAGGKPDGRFTYDGVSLRDVFLGKAQKSTREWILAMGSHPAVLTDAGVENVYYFRDRVLCDGRFKLFVGTDRKPEKLVDLNNDPTESNDLSGNPEYATVLARLSSVVEQFPVMDNDHNYERLESTSGKKKILPSKTHKKGYLVD
jgi:arylsulfatase A-like enzyme